MSRTLVNFIIDLFGFVIMLGILATGLLVRYVLPPGSGQWRSVWGLSRHDWGDVHFWMAVGLGAVILVHVALHWGWVCGVVRRRIPGLPSMAPAHSRLRRSALGVLILALTAALVAGFLVVAGQAVIEDGPGGGGRQFRGGRAESRAGHDPSPSPEAFFDQRPEPGRERPSRGEIKAFDGCVFTGRL
ncbi:MAG: DUF4405 domain-containing protein [Planctomycetes bacterium]|nr:DUF4405 domain-containing protein [Planctomycetota bacterium]